MKISTQHTTTTTPNWMPDKSALTVVCLSRWPTRQPALMLMVWPRLRQVDLFYPTFYCFRVLREHPFLLTMCIIMQIAHATWLGKYLFVALAQRRRETAQIIAILKMVKIYAQLRSYFAHFLLFQSFAFLRLIFPPSESEK